jgi:nucleotide-binding universal stress UspA family protein
MMMYMGYNKILLATDGSSHARNAAKKAVELQKIWNSKVIIIHSIKDNRTPSELYPNVDALYRKYTILEDVYKDAGTELLKRTKEMFGGNKDFVEYRLIEKVTPSKYIIQVVEEENIDLVVLGSRGIHSKIKKTFLGTVSTNVAKNAECDVLIVK